MSAAHQTQTETPHSRPEKWHIHMFDDTPSRLSEVGEYERHTSGDGYMRGVAPDLDRPTVLVVDDEPSIAGLLAEFLEGAGYRALTASNGRNALTIVHAVHPELVLTDCMMPDLDGVGLLEVLRSEPGTRDIPIILMSSARPRGNAFGDVPFLEKPFDLDTVLDFVTIYAAEPRS